MSNCSVYIIYSTSGHYKIGVSNNPKKRVKALRRTQGPYEYSLVYYWVFGSRGEAYHIEQWLHKVFEGQRVNGEWFELSPTDLIFIGNDAIDLASAEYTA
jgi:predicted GIY-YIG superfamily endonuclease